ncbi:hypothetical protein EV175_006837, partial [Coemansia sp. RSA 1933]
MASRTPPRPSVDRDRIDMRGSPTPSRTRPSYIPLPSSISSTSPSTASTLTSIAINGNGNGHGNGNGNGVFRSGSSLQYQRPSEYSIGRASLDDPRTYRSSSLTATTRTSSPGTGTQILPPSSSSSLLRTSLIGIAEHHTAAGFNGMAGQRPHSQADSMANSESRSRSSSRNAGTGPSDVQGEYNGYSTSSGTQSMIVADEGDDGGERILPVKVAVRVRPLLVGGSSPADSAIGGAGG